MHGNLAVPSGGWRDHWAPASWKLQISKPPWWCSYKMHDEAVKLDRVSEIPSILLEALLVCCHERRPAVHVSEIADLANDILSRQGELLELSARQVGGKLKNLGFRTERLDSAG